MLYAFQNVIQYHTKVIVIICMYKVIERLKLWLQFSCSIIRKHFFTGLIIFLTLQIRLLSYQFKFLQISKCNVAFLHLFTILIHAVFFCEVFDLKSKLLVELSVYLQSMCRVSLYLLFHASTDTSNVSLFLLMFIVCALASLLSVVSSLALLTGLSVTVSLSFASS